MTLGQIASYLIENAPYYLVVCIVLLFWDLIDFYVELHEISFLRTPTFGIYYFVRVFFSISTMEINSALNIVNAPNKYVIAFVIPIVFTTVLQNLVVNIAGEDQVNIKDLFTRFRKVVISGLTKYFDAAQVKMKIQLLRSGIDTHALQQECQFILSPEEFANLEKGLAGKPDEEKRSSYITLIAYRSPDRAKQLLKTKRPR